MIHALQSLSSNQASSSIPFFPFHNIPNLMAVEFPFPSLVLISHVQTNITCINTFLPAYLPTSYPQSTHPEPHLTKSTAMEKPEVTKPSELITLQVGERRFTTYERILTEGSPWFEAQLKSWRKNARNDGPFFVDVDPDVFQHVLRFLQSDVFPRTYLL